MKFILRDDDLNFFSTPEQIEYYYNHWSRSVLFAAIPFIAPNRDSFGNTFSYSGQDKFFEISANRELASYINEVKKYEICQHGVSHAKKGKRYEFEQTRSREYVEIGFNELVKTFDRIVKVFVAPHDRVSSQNLKIFSAIGMSVIKAHGLKQFDFSFQSLENLFKQIEHVHKNGRRFPYPFPLYFRKIPAFFSIRMIDDWEVMQEQLSFALKNNSHLCVTNHLHEHSKARVDNLKRLDEWLYSNNIQEISASQFISID